MYKDDGDLWRIMAPLVARPETSERKEYGPKTEFWTPALQAIGLALCGIWCLGGLGFLLRQLAITQVGRHTLLINAVILVIMLTLAAFVSGLLSNQYREQAKYLIGLLWIEELTAATFLIAEEWQAYILLAWIISQFAAIVLAQRLAREVHNPLYPTPPMAAVMEQMAASVRKQVEIKVVREPVPVFLGSNGVWVEDWPAPENVEPQVEIAQDFLDLIEFAHLGLERGLSRDNVWCAPDRSRYTLSSGTVISRPQYDKMVAKLAKWRLAAKNHSGAWAFCDGVDRQRIRDTLEKAALVAAHSPVEGPEAPE